MNISKNSDQLGRFDGVMVLVFGKRLGFSSGRHSAAKENMIPIIQAGSPRAPGLVAIQEPPKTAPTMIMG